MPVCASPTTGNAFLSGTLDYLDCQARGFGAEGYQALSVSGSPVMIALTSLLTVFVAIYGIRLLLGQSFEVRDGVMAGVKVGVVLLIATSWPAWRVLAYDTVLSAPAELAGSLGASPDTLSARLQGVDDAIVGLTLYGSGRAEAASQGQRTGNVEQLFQPPAISDDIALGFGRLAFMSGTIGTIGGMRLIGGLLLALAPLFAGLLLFEVTRGVFLGWLRTLGGLMLGILLATLILAAELAILEPWLSDALAQRAARYATPAAPIELFALTTGFSFIQLLALGVIARLSYTLHIPTGSRGAAMPMMSSEPRSLLASQSMPIAQAPGGMADAPVASRALAVSDAIAATQRREADLMHTNFGPTRSIGLRTNLAQDTMLVPANGPSRRRTSGRVSPGAARRDRRI